jgi:hypothetical protein
VADLLHLAAQAYALSQGLGRGARLCGNAGLPVPAKLAKLEIVPHDQPLEIEFRDLLARNLLIRVHDAKLDPLPDNYVVTEIPPHAIPRIKAWLDSLADPEQRKIERRRWKLVEEKT